VEAFAAGTKAIDIAVVPLGSPILTIFANFIGGLLSFHRLKLKELALATCINLLAIDLDPFLFFNYIYNNIIVH
jgi:hypothetical protein